MAAYAIHGKGPQRFGPMAKHADAFRVRGGRCRNWPVPSRTRCRFHGGLSLGSRRLRAKQPLLLPSRKAGNGGSQSSRLKVKGSTPADGGLSPNCLLRPSGSTVQVPWANSHWLTERHASFIASR